MPVFKVGLWIAAMFSLVLGLWLIKRPRKAIDMQIAFYRRINWKMEPLDLKREILNTRIMGVTAALCGAAMAALLLAGPAHAAMTALDFI